MGPSAQAAGSGERRLRARVGWYEVVWHTKHQGWPGTGWVVHLRAGLASGTQFKEAL